MNWGLLEHNEKKVFRIPVGDMSKEEVEKIISELLKHSRCDIFMENRRKKLDKINEKIYRNNCNNS